MTVLQKLVPLLVEKTRQNKLFWLRTSYGYKVEVGGNWITLEGTQESGRLTVFNVIGDIADFIDYDAANDQHEIAVLYKLVKARVLGFSDPSLEQVEQLLKAM
jgi:hypothetical protein